MNTTKNTRNEMSTPKIFMMSHQFELMELRYLRSCVCAESTFATDLSTFSSMRTAISPCSATIVASC